MATKGTRGTRQGWWGWGERQADDSNAIKKTVDSEEAKKKLAGVGLVGRFMGPEEFTAYWRNFEKIIEPLIPEAKKYVRRVSRSGPSEPQWGAGPVEGIGAQGVLLSSSPVTALGDSRTPIGVMPSGRRTAPRDPPGRLRVAESEHGVRTPLDWSAGRTLLLAGRTQRNASRMRCRGRRVVVQAVGNTKGAFGEGNST